LAVHVHRPIARQAGTVLYDRRMKIIAEIPAAVESARKHPALPQALLGATMLGTLLLAACVYHMPIRQGNYLDPTAVAQVKAGMTHSQVRFLLGTPMVPGGFDNSRWDYDYYLDEGRIKRQQRAHVTVYFSGNVVARVVSDVQTAPVTTVTRGGVKYPVPF
jgi:outer membrane protein assembly factor BamE (lipoprotein component of BamABCDE complex)